VTDACGNFAINGIEPGKYRLSASRTGFVPTQYGARGLSRRGTTLSLQPGKHLKDLAVRLTPHAVIAGRVVDEKREPIVLGQVQAMTYSFRAGKKELATSQMVHTNDLGEYRIYGLSPGKYYVTAALKNDRDEDEVDRSAVPRSNSYVTTYYPGVVDPAAAVLLEVGPGAQLGGINLTLAKARTFRVRGRVQGVQDITVNLVPHGQSPWASLTPDTTTGPNGSFETDQVLPPERTRWRHGRSWGKETLRPPGSRRRRKRCGQSYIDAGAGNRTHWPNRRGGRCPTQHRCRRGSLARG